MHSLYAVSDIGNGPEVLKLYVEEMNDLNSQTTAKRTYNLQNIEKAFNASKRVQGNSSSPSANASNAIKRIADLFASVKRMDANYNPNSVSELLMNEDGTPKKLYRFTNLDDTVIKPDYRGAIWMADNDWVTIGIETHNRNEIGYKPDPSLNNMYVLVSSFRDGGLITPVKLEIKEFNDKANSLYVAIALESFPADNVTEKEQDRNRRDYQ